MPTLTMQAIADLAQVRREVVSMWRKRYVESAHPFPAPLADGELVFEAADVADWLRATGRGNNPDAPLEAVLHSSRATALLDDLDASTTLLLLHDLLGGPLAELEPPELQAVANRPEMASLVDFDAVLGYLARADFVSTVDELAEAAFSGRNLLDRLVNTFSGPRGAWSDEALTRPGAELVRAVVSAIAEQRPRWIDPQGPGGHLLATMVCTGQNDDAQLAFGINTEAATAATERAAHRLLAAHAGTDQVVDRATHGADQTPHLTLGLRQQTNDPVAFFEEVDSLLLDRGPADAVLVIGPAELLVEALTDDHLMEARGRLLMPSPHQPADLRYVARLPKGLSRFGGRRRLALWVFATAQPHAGVNWTVYGEHADSDLDTASRSAIAADVAAALNGGAALTSHAFFHSTRLATEAYLRRRSLVLAPFETGERGGGESMARIWELDDGILRDAIQLRAHDSDGIDPTIAWPMMAPDFAREIRGTRLPAAAIGAPQPGSALVLGPAEIRDPRRRGTRAIDRLVLEKTAAHSTLTEPGDVIFTAEGGAAAFVDIEGGHVLQAPARALRCTGTGRSGRILHPQVVAVDIARQQGRDRRTWRLRTLPGDAAPSLEIAANRLQQRRDQLNTQLTALDALESELIQGLAAGILAAAPVTTSKEN